MISKKCFIKATEQYNDLENHVPAYYFRRAFSLDAPNLVKLSIAACGFYELFFNGERITRGFLSPYISNTDDLIYYDEYELQPKDGENVIGVLLGNGFQNNPGGYIWDFEKAEFRGAPCFALCVSMGDEILLQSDESFRTSPSPIRSDDYRFGEFYDANYEIDGWCDVNFDDSLWGRAMGTVAPKGELKEANVAPIIKEQEIKPVQIIPCEDGGYIYDFGISNAGVCRLSIEGEKGQTIILRHADSMKNGDLNLAQVWFKREKWDRDRLIVHRDTYVCSGRGREVYQPTFTYHGFRYVKVSGITPNQAVKDLLTFLVYHTELHPRGDFSCSCSVATTLQEMTRRSILSNFHHFPTDCPQREKNGWTADAALSCEAALLNFDPERNYREWLVNIRKAQREDGALPGIVPTGGWGFHWGNGPAWDCVLAYLPYYVYIYRGETEMISESVDAFLSYLRYLRTRCDERGLLSIGLGDWCHVGGISPKAPLVLTDSVMSMDIASKIAQMLDAIGCKDGAEFARGEMDRYRSAIRTNLIDRDSLMASGNCQSSQAMCLYYGVYEKNEEKEAFARLLDMIHEFDDHIDVGVLGGRVIFHVLTAFGHSDLAFKMITRDDYPSYGNWIKRGATTLWENFMPEGVSSMNHHFWGDISAWFIKCLAGIRLNPDLTNAREVLIAPHFVEALDSASAYHLAPAGRVSASWHREGDSVIVDLVIPEGMKAVLQPPEGFCIQGGTRSSEVYSGSYRLVRK